MSEATVELELQEQIARIKHTQTLIDLHFEETRKFIAEARKLEAEQGKLNRDRFPAPWLAVISGLTAGGAIFAAGAAFFHYFLQSNT
jgi:hypothetical protein